MVQLTWDERSYETGIDRGVLYIPEQGGVAWSGITSVEESLGSNSSESLYLDGVKYAQSSRPDDFQAKLSAFTYPDEFEICDGSIAIDSGLTIGNQQTKVFGLSYRTKLGDENDPDAGYRIHLLYNLVALPDSRSYLTTTNTLAPLEFSWEISGIPEDALNYFPTAHVILDSTELAPDILTAIETILYGDESNDSRLPDLEYLMLLTGTWDPMLLFPNTTTGLATITSPGHDLTPTLVDGIYLALPTTHLTPTIVDGVYTWE